MPNTTPRSFPRSIVAAIDAQGQSDHALRAAAWLHERFGARLELVHAFPTRPVLWGREDEMPEWTAGTEAAGAALRAAVRDTLKSAPAELALKTSADKLRLDVVSGHPVEVILDRARAADADLIVLGAHKKRGVLDFGSTARGVLSKSSSSVWVQVEPPRPIRRILVPIDFSADSLAALRVARDLASELGATLTVLHSFVTPMLGMGLGDSGMASMLTAVDDVRHSSELQLERVIGELDWKDVEHASRFEEGDPAQRVLELEREFDLIAMSTHGHTGLSAAILGSVTYSVLRAAHTPVLALRAPARSFRI
jgi:universal stress protein E